MTILFLKIHIVPCYTTSPQWTTYDVEYTKQKERNLQKLGKQGLYDDDNFDYHIRTRQACNIVYEDDTFRNKGTVEQKFQQYEQMKANQHFSVEGTLSLFSPKFYEIMIRIQKFVNEGIPTGSVIL